MTRIVGYTSALAEIVAAGCSVCEVEALTGWLIAIAGVVVPVACQISALFTSALDAPAVLTLPPNGSPTNRR